MLDVEQKAETHREEEVVVAGMMLNGGGGIGHTHKKKIDRKTKPIGVMPDIFYYYADRPKYIK